MNRSPWVTDPSSVWALNDQKTIEGYIAASAFTDIFYIARRIKDIPTAFQSIRICIDAFDISSVDKSTIALVNLRINLTIDSLPYSTVNSKDLFA